MNAWVIHGAAQSTVVRFPCSYNTLTHIQGSVCVFVSGPGEQASLLVCPQIQDCYICKSPSPMLILYQFSAVTVCMHACFNKFHLLRNKKEWSVMKNRSFDVYAVRCLGSKEDIQMAQIPRLRESRFSTEQNNRNRGTRLTSSIQTTLHFCFSKEILSST